MTPSKRLALLAILCLPAGACSSGSKPAASPPSLTARFLLAGDTPPDLMDVPFPTNAYLANGKVIDPIPGVDGVVAQGAQLLTHELGKLDGFGRSTFSFFYVDDSSQPLDDDGNPGPAAIDPTTLPIDEDACVADTSSVYLIDLAATDPSTARIRCRGKIHDDSSTSSIARPVVAVGPGLGVLLEEGHSYAAVLTSRVKGTSGAPIAASQDFQGVVAGTQSGSVATMYGTAISQVQAMLGSALAADGAQIVAIAPYTTNTATGEMFTLRGSLEAMPVPALAWDAASMAPMGAVKFAAPVGGVLPTGFTAALDDWLGVAPKLADGSDDLDYLVTGVLPHDKIAALGTAVFQAANFLDYSAGGYGDVDDATFARDASGHIVPSSSRPTTPIWVSFAVPTTPMPPGGYPCVIVAHGVPASRADMFMQAANALAGAGWMVAGIDMITQGPRAVESKYQIDQVTDWQNAPGATYAGPDGLADNLDASGHPSVKGSRNGNLDIAGDGVNFGAWRDQVRSAEMDTSQLARVLVGNPDLSPLQTGDAAPKIDPTKIAYVGGSYGAMVGEVTAALEPDIRTWVLNVGAGQFLLHANEAPNTEAAVKQAALVAFGITGQFVDETNLVAVLGQTAIDPSDPMNFAPYLVTSPGSFKGAPLARANVLMVEALYDETLSNSATEAFVRAAGLGLAVPNVGPNAGITTLAEMRDPTTVPDRLPLANVNPDASGLIHDTPVAGVTSVLVQVTGTHYRNLLVSSDPRLYPAPFNASTEPLATPYSVAESYLPQQSMMTRFFADAFQGAVPNVTGFVPPVRDVDEDGVPDATDPDPNNPNVK
jgi:hypothetical protein